MRAARVMDATSISKSHPLETSNRAHIYVIRPPLLGPDDAPGASLGPASHCQTLDKEDLNHA